MALMISVVFCSIDPIRAESIEKHYIALLGDEPHEIVAIRDARSLSEGYNRGLAQTTGDIVIFSHDDIEFLEPATWLSKLKAHLEVYDVVGLAGTSRIVSAVWAHAGPPYTFGQVTELAKGSLPFQVNIFGAPAPAVPGIQTLDGLFIATRREVLDQIRFDEKTFDGFHGYDIDFSFCAYLAGFQLAVVTDLPVFHASHGSFDQKWEHYAKRFAEKHAVRLPPFTPKPVQHAVAGAWSKEEALEIMKAPRVWWSYNGIPTGSLNNQRPSVASPVTTKPPPR